MQEANKTESGTVSAWRAAKTVFWSFFGVRRKTDYQTDINQLKPAHVIAAGIMGAALLVGMILVLVSWVTA